MLQPTVAEIGHQLASHAHRLAREADSEFEVGVTRHSFWAMFDLSASYRFRAEYGERAAFVRAETFVGILEEVTSGQPSVRVVKELGDAVLLDSDGFRSVLELALLLDTVRSAWDATRYKGHPDLGHRAAATFGGATTVKRTGGRDALGATIDRLARVSSDKGGVENPLMTIDLAAYEAARDIVNEYDYLTVGPLRTGTTKSGEPSLRLFDVTCDTERARSDRAHFAPVRAHLDKTHGDHS